jgi:hypothetical protein
MMVDVDPIEFRRHFCMNQERVWFTERLFVDSSCVASGLSMNEYVKPEIS